MGPCPNRPCTRRPPLIPAQLRREPTASAALCAAGPILAADPVTQFRRCFDQAVASELNGANAMVLRAAAMAAASAPHRVAQRPLDAAGLSSLLTHYEEPRKANEKSLPQPGGEPASFPGNGLEPSAILGRAERISAKPKVHSAISSRVRSEAGLGLGVSQQSTVSARARPRRANWKHETPLWPVVRCTGRRPGVACCVLPFEFDVLARGDRTRLHDRFAYRPARDQAGSACWCGVPGAS